MTEAPVTEAPLTEAPLTPAAVPDVERSTDADTDEGVEAGTDAADPTAPDVEQGRRWWPYMAIAAALLVGASLLSPAGRHQWDVSIFRQPTHYTTLSFVAAAKLPSTATAGKPVSLVVALGNNEGRLVDYPYVVTSANATGSDVRVVQRATVAVPAGHVREVAINVAPTCTSASCRLAVLLPEQAESIDVLLRVHRPTK
jgi:hypothetical protein